MEYVQTSHDHCCIDHVTQHGEQGHSHKCDLQTTTMFNQRQADDTSVTHSSSTSVIYNGYEIWSENMNIQINPSKENQLIHLNL